VFNKAYFKYTPEDIAKVIEAFFALKEAAPQQNRNVMREFVQAIQIVEDVGKFYLKI